MLGFDAGEGGSGRRAHVENLGEPGHNFRQVQRREPVQPGRFDGQWRQAAFPHQRDEGEVIAIGELFPEGDVNIDAGQARDFVEGILDLRRIVSSGAVIEQMIDLCLRGQGQETSGGETLVPGGPGDRRLIRAAAEEASQCQQIVTVLADAAAADIDPAVFIEARPQCIQMGAEVVADGRVGGVEQLEDIEVGGKSSRTQVPIPEMHIDNIQVTQGQGHD